ncbi:penicillin-binding transpeptidase domain-containing protein [Desulfoplanes formicivorans]|uniref:Penicillin-binding protein n=1 Tax=Desulfoplanes formicivorans TaxID=1592317 RepID=A0A194AFE9_9BACT|nr:penicillin-binding transpeptidase domain-containing protein [Desulfoplanes formicivorans]GAU07816.1 hypothetical protein DPF_0515 [Desulfoplanes formicivorans]
MARKGRTSSEVWSGRKIVMLAVVFTLGLLAIWCRAYYVQIVSGHALVERAKQQYWASRQLQGERGAIVDRQGRLLAKSVSTYSVFINPAHIRDKRKTVTTLHKIVGGSKKRLNRLVREKSSFVWVARQIGDRQIAQLRKADLPGVYLKKEWMRLYPQGHVAAQLLGFVGIDGKGLEGLERSLDDVLSGSSARQRVQRDAAGAHLYSGRAQNNVDGATVSLTIDSVIQSVAEDALAESVVTFHGKTGVCLVVEVPTGDILAWAHYPFFDPNQYAKSNARVWKNRMCLDLVEPGSTFKPFVVAAALQHSVCTPDSRFFCEQGEWRIGRNRIRDTHAYETLRVDEIMRYSSNIGMSKIGLALGPERLYRQLRRFGFLGTTDVRVPGEAKGLIRPPQTWTKFDLAAASFGQGVAITPLQLARGYLVLANKGKMRPLRIVRGIDKAPSTRQVVRRDVAEAVLRMLRDVVEDDGTGKLARIPGVEVGGKTGTAQKPTPKGGYGDHFLASFVGFIPALEPKYLILVMVDEPHPQHYGGVVSAPVFKKVGMKLLAYRGEAPLQERTMPVAGETVRDVSIKSPVQRGLNREQATDDKVPDLCGAYLRHAVATMARHGVVPQIMGKGTVVRRQQPKPGSSWNQSKAGSWKLWVTTKRSKDPCR